jgi:hypothetical protein
MWVYAHWDNGGQAYIQPFHKQEKAAEHAFTRVSSYVARDMRNYGNKNMPRELSLVKVELDNLEGCRSFENALKVIAMYEDYMGLIVGQRSPCHGIRDVKMVE